MARASNNGWDFVKVGKSYQYKEEHPTWIAEVFILEDNSDDEYYNFKARIDKATVEFKNDPEPFLISFIKNLKGVFSGMPQLYENPEYRYEAKYIRKL